MTEENKINPRVQEDLDLLRSAVDKAAELRTGTFSQRNPLPGKMVRCPFCRRRRRANEQIPCCNAIVTRQVEADVPGNAFKGRRKNPRLTRHRPPLFQMRQILLELEAEPLLIGELSDKVRGQVHGKGSVWGHTPQTEVKMEHLAIFVENVILRNLKIKAKKYRDMQKRSRKVNRHGF